MNQLCLHPIGRFRIVNQASQFFDENEKKKALAIKVSVIAAAVFTVITLAALLLPSHPFIFTFGAYATCYLAFVTSYFLIIKMMQRSSGESTITIKDQEYQLTKGNEEWKIERSEQKKDSTSLTQPNGQTTTYNTGCSRFWSKRFNLISFEISQDSTGGSFTKRE